jgi:hypothetical protein
MGRPTRKKTPAPFTLPELFQAEGSSSNLQ